MGEVGCSKAIYLYFLISIFSMHAQQQNTHWHYHQKYFFRPFEKFYFSHQKISFE